MANAGINPIQYDTDLGKVRVTVGDTDYDATNGYSYFSDEAINVALELGGGSISRAVGILVKQLALSLIISGQSIKADDFAINTLGKGKDLLLVANAYFEQADAEDVRASHEADGAYAVVSNRLRPPYLGFGADRIR